MSSARRETVADWMMLGAAPLLLIALFLAWSHQFSAAVLARYGGSSALQGVPHSPDAWQVYSIADILLAALALALVAVALRGGRPARWAVAVALAVALAFTIHALSVPPTNGATLFDAAAGAYVDTGASAGAGETLALAALALGAAGVALSFTADP